MSPRAIRRIGSPGGGGIGRHAGPGGRVPNNKRQQVPRRGERKRKGWRKRIRAAGIRRGVGGGEWGGGLVCDVCGVGGGRTSPGVLLKRPRGKSSRPSNPSPGKGSVRLVGVVESDGLNAGGATGGLRGEPKREPGIFFVVIYRTDKRAPPVAGSREGI